MSTRATGFAILIALVCLVLPGQGQPATLQQCPRCGWRVPATASTMAVATTADLYRAIAHATPDTTIALADGEYRLDRTLDLSTPRVVLRGRSGDFSKVILRGDGMLERRVGVAVSVGAEDVTLTDVTIGHVGYHGIQVRGERGASRAMVHRVRVVDTGQQLIKGSTAGGPLYADAGIISCSTIEYSDHAPSDYTNGIDVLGGKDWTVRHNTLRRIRGPLDLAFAAGPAILFWANSQNTTLERNQIVDSFRGIALGLGPGASGRFARNGERTTDHDGGRVSNNVVINTHRWADEGIEASAARNVHIDRNTVIVNGRLPWSISLRFRHTSGIVSGNRTNRGVTFREGARASLIDNVLDIFARPQLP